MLFIPASPIGIIGSGQVGSALAHALTRAGLSGIISNSRGSENLKPFVAEIDGSIRAGTREEAAQQDIILEISWSELSEALAGPPASTAGLSSTPIMRSSRRSFSRLNCTAKRQVPSCPSSHGASRAVKAFNHLPAALLALDPAVEGDVGSHSTLGTVKRRRRRSAA